jgi:hypothetical protein
MHAGCPCNSKPRYSKRARIVVARRLATVEYDTSVAQAQEAVAAKMMWSSTGRSSRRPVAMASAVR